MGIVVLLLTVNIAIVGVLLVVSETLPFITDYNGIIDFIVRKLTHHGPEQHQCVDPAGPGTSPPV